MPPLRFQGDSGTSPGAAAVQLPLNVTIQSDFATALLHLI